MIRTLHRLGDRLLERLLPGAEARADTCYYVGWQGNYCVKNCYPNPTGSICVKYGSYGSCSGPWTNLGRC
ncbi:hypothetical protein AAH991_33440 [Microbispora sp. ZYX-F-249]|uniref:Uncharacterized protein n=1 Tax=Microbispora maris TaxID=3144104 RepID=A0ABV0AXQ9_9ACTN